MHKAAFSNKANCHILLTQNNVRQVASFPVGGAKLFAKPMPSAGKAARFPRRHVNRLHAPMEMLRGPGKHP